ncbi:alpha/beta hydrolase [Kribbella sp. NBC_01505]|uniref:alpha/beta fold hydrolase n=1 Tax=Kribbella sp. NBC_01505 TaxID=2903580 RepID=UPI0038686A07
MPEVASGPFTIAYVESGTGEPLVMCHGNEADHRQYDGLRPLLAPDIHALSYDQRDSGDTTGFTGDYTMADLGQDCIAFIEALGLDSAHVVGTSFGGMIAMHAAIARPERVRSLVLISTSPAMALFSREMLGLAERTPEERRAFMAEAILSPAADPQLRTEIAELLTGRSPEQSTRRLAAMTTHDCRDLLPTITAPTLVLHGSDDPVIPAATGARIAELIPGATLQVLDGLRHGLTFENRADTAQLIGDFVLRSSGVQQ